MQTKTVRLSKYEHEYLFRYEVGQEDRVVEEIMRLADDRTCDFDWLDAAELSFQVTEAAVEGLIEQS